MSISWVGALIGGQGGAGQGDRGGASRALGEGPSKGTPFLCVGRGAGEGAQGREGAGASLIPEKRKWLVGGNAGRPIPSSVRRAAETAVWGRISACLQPAAWDVTTGSPTWLWSLTTPPTPILANASSPSGFPLLGPGRDGPSDLWTQGPVWQKWSPAVLCPRLRVFSVAEERVSGSPPVSRLTPPRCEQGTMGT